MKADNLGFFVKLTLLFAVYLSTALMGLRIDAVSGFATLVWIPTGLSLAALLVFGLKLFPAITLGAFVANYITGASPMVAGGIAIGNTLEAVIGTYLLSNVADFRPKLERLKDVMHLIVFAALFSTLFSPTIGVSSLLIGGVITSDAYVLTWIAWWIGDLISNLIVAPIILVFTSRPTIGFDPRRAVELAGLTVFLVLVGLIVFRDFGGIRDMHSSLTYVLFPPLIWAALRFGPREAISGTLLLSCIAIVSTAQGLGPFARGTVSESLLHLQGYMSVTAVTTMIMAAIVSERAFLEKRKDEFISVASHELKTPLAGIKVYAQILERRLGKKHDTQTSHYLRQMNKQIDRLSSLVMELLDIRRIEEGKITFNTEPFNIGNLIQEIVSDVSGTTKHKITVTGSKNIDIVADRDRIGQVLVNLLSNAIKYSPSRKNISIKYSKNSDVVVVRVQDFGSGIPQNDQKKIFERFYQTEGREKDYNASLGLGLYISKEIIERHGGKIWVKSKVGRGSSFFFTLPL